MKKDVAVALSGGIDSSVAALLLKKKGWNVTAVHLVMKEKGKTEDAQACRAVAKKINVPIHFLDIRKDFQKKLVDVVVDEYKRGKTPNPCVICNEKIKFKALFSFASSKGIKIVATGHYVRRIKKCLGEAGSSRQEWFIRRGRDEKKDQSYFLSHLKPAMLASCIFPVGEYEKSEVRRIAEKHNLPNYKRKESQGLCFLEGTLEEFISLRVRENSGLILDQNGKELGFHSGLSRYTIGQRKGIKIGQSGPYYVVSKDYEKNELHVSNVGDELRLFGDDLLLDPTTWNGERRLQSFTDIASRMIASKDLFLKIRYGHPEEPVLGLQIDPHGLIRVKLKRKIRAVTPGQAAVFYDKQGIVWLGTTVVSVFNS